MNISGNARGEASKAAIRTAILELLEQRQIEKISVREICETAGVNRSTFYAHYTDIHDLMEKMEAELAEPISGWLYGEGATTDSVLSADSIARLVGYLRENREFYHIYFSLPSESHAMRESSEHMRQNFIEPYLEQAGHYAREEFEYQYTFCKAGFLAVLRCWLDGGCAEPDAVIAGLLQKILWRCLQ